MKARFFASSLLFTVAISALARRDFSKVEIKAISVAKNIYMLEGNSLK